MSEQVEMLKALLAESREFAAQQLSWARSAEARAKQAEAACAEKDEQLALLKPGGRYAWKERAEAAESQLTALRRERDALQQQKDGAYLERNQVVAALAKAFPSGVARTAIEGWSEDWHGCVYIDLPTGQASWHFHDSQAYLFAGLPPYKSAWDGHATDEKYQRLAALKPAAPAPSAAKEQP